MLPLTLVLAVMWLFAAITSCILFARSGDSEVKCAWFVLIAALPVAGAVIYLLSSIKRKPCGILEMNAAEQSGIGGAAQRLCGTVEAGYDEAVYYKSGAEFFNSVITEILGAKKSVYIEYYIISRGQIYNRLVSAVKKAVENGAEVKIITDGLGTAFRLKRSDIKQLEKLGAEVKVFNRLTPLPRAKINVRDHRKIVTVDGRIAFTGGFNLADEYANITSPYGCWKDSGVSVTGGAAKVFEGMFLSLFSGTYKMDAPKGGKHFCLPYYDSPYARAFAEEAYVNAINRAKERVHILTPYFCPGERTAAALKFAAMRGVDVKIIFPHIPDKKYAFEISKAYAAEISRSGCRFYRFTPGFMHAKCLICDGEAYLGSYNFDFRSMHYNYECGVMFKGDFVQNIEADFSECLALSAEFSEGRISVPRRLYRTALKLFAPLV